jgi:hypothetical protein
VRETWAARFQTLHIWLPSPGRFAAEKVASGSQRMNPKVIHYLSGAIVLLVVCFTIAGQTPQVSYRGELSELAGKTRLALVVTKLGVVNAENPDQAIVETALKLDKKESVRPVTAYGAIAKPLNKYIKKYKSLTAAPKISDAEFIVFFSFTEFRRILDIYYPYGEMYVIVKTLNGKTTSGRIVWRTEKPAYAGDAAEDFLRALKKVTGVK